MPQYRRAFVPGGTFFFTVVTAGRSRFLCDPEARAILHECLRRAQQRRPFIIEAIVLLPDHLHTIWTLPPGDGEFSTRWGDIKSNFVRGWRAGGGREVQISQGKEREGRRGVWQPRFMEHTIRDEVDFIAHVEYIHFNPVKHELVSAPRDWSWSSFHRYVRQGVYDSDWGAQAPPDMAKVKTDLLE